MYKGGNAMLFTLTLEGMRFHAFHGTMEVERELGQVLEISLHFTYELGVKDVQDPRKIVSYAQVFSLVENVVMSNKFEAMEALAFEIAKRILNSIPSGQVAEVGVCRGQLYVPGVLGSSEVNILLTRDDLLEECGE